MTETNPKQKHATQTIIYCISKTFERVSFYGIRALLVIYLAQFFYNNSTDQVTEIFGWFVLSVAVSKIIGALLGDLLNKARTTMIIGGILQTLGCLLMCLNSIEAIFIGMGCIALGSGLYTSNVLAEFARGYLNKLKIIDAGFTIYYTAINIGSFLGAFFIGIIGEYYGYIYGFITAGICMFISTVIILFIQHKQINIASNGLQPKIKNRTTILVVCFIAVILFWNFHDFSFTAFENITRSIKSRYSSNINSLDLINSSISILLSVFAAIIWSFIYYNQLKKIVIGFLSLAIGLGVLFFINAPYSGNSMIMVIITMLIIGFAEIHISPILYSIITRSVNPKYLAIALSTCFLPGLFISKLLIDFKYDAIGQMDNTTILIIGISGLGAIGLLLFIFLKLGILKMIYKT